MHVITREECMPWHFVKVWDYPWQTPHALLLYTIFFACCTVTSPYFRVSFTPSIYLLRGLPTLLTQVSFFSNTFLPYSYSFFSIPSNCPLIYYLIYFFTNTNQLFYSFTPCSITSPMLYFYFHTSASTHHITLAHSSLSTI